MKKIIFISLFTISFFPIIKSQNIGISNDASFTTPQSPLHIYWTSDGNLLQLSRSSSSNTGLTFSVNSDDYSILNRQNNALIFGTNALERMRILSSGNILFNRTTTSYSTDLVEAQGDATFPDALNGYTNQASGGAIWGINSATGGTAIYAGANLNGIYSYFTSTSTGSGYSNPGGMGIIASGPNTDFGAGTNAYRFGVYGIFPDANNYSRRSASVLGYFSDSYMGGLAYVRSNGTVYGLCYIGSATTSAKNSNQPIFGIGFGGNGGVIGGYTKGEIFGFISQGKDFANYNIGNVYTTGVSANLVSLNDKQVPLYTITSKDVKVYIDGSSELVNGIATIKFDEINKKIIDGTKNITVTVSPMGECNGLYIEKTDTLGFTVKELNHGKNSVKFSWIAIAYRKVNENNISLPEYISDNKFNENIEKVLLPINDENALPIWWDGSKIRFDNHPLIKSEIPNLNQYKIVQNKINHLNKNN